MQMNDARLRARCEEVRQIAPEMTKCAKRWKDVMKSERAGDERGCGGRASPQSSRELGAISDSLSMCASATITDVILKTVKCFRWCDTRSPANPSHQIEPRFYL